MPPRFHRIDTHQARVDCRSHEFEGSGRQRQGANIAILTCLARERAHDLSERRRFDGRRGIGDECADRCEGIGIGRDGWRAGSKGDEEGGGVHVRDRGLRRTELGRVRAHSDTHYGDKTDQS